MANLTSLTGHLRDTKTSSRARICSNLGTLSLQRRGTHSFIAAPWAIVRATQRHGNPLDSVLLSMTEWPWTVVLGHLSPKHPPGPRLGSGVYNGARDPVIDCDQTNLC